MTNPPNMKIHSCINFLEYNLNSSWIWIRHSTWGTYNGDFIDKSRKSIETKFPISYRISMVMICLVRTDGWHQRRIMLWCDGNGFRHDGVKSSRWNERCLQAR